MGCTLSKESKLAINLRKIYNQKEHELNPSESATIFNEWGRLYKKKNTDKINLIQSAALLNAAIIRQPCNQKFNDDLHVFCLYVLEVAGAKNQQSNLVEISKRVELKVTSMRKEVVQGLAKIDKIPYEVNEDELKEMEKKKVIQVKSLQDGITEKYTVIMDYISKECIKIMGEPPCRYAVTGMGSLARREITPYSDFEHVILLEEGVQNKKDFKKILEYFRWFSVIFQIIVINLKETILPCVAIPLLNDFSKPGGHWFFDTHATCGISFDGMNPHACKFSLGRTQKTVRKPWATELIKPVSEMVNYLTFSEEVKNGYHLSDILTKTGFVSGDEGLHREFVDQVRIELANADSIHKISLIFQLQDDLNNFNVGKRLFTTYIDNSFDIKRIIYRTVTLFISALGRFHAIDECSCFGIITKLQEQQQMNDETAHLLSYAVAVACEARLRVYMEKQGQDDCLLQDGMYSMKDLNLATQLIDAIGERSLLNYVEIAIALRYFIVYRFGSYISITLEPINKYNAMLLLKLYDRMEEGWDYIKDNSPSVAYNEDTALGVHQIYSIMFMSSAQTDRALSLLEYTVQQENNTNERDLILLAACLAEADRLAEAIEKYELAEDRLQSKSQLTTYEERLLCVSIALHGISETNVGQYEKALSLFKKFMDNADRSYPVFKFFQPLCLTCTAACLAKVNRLDEALPTALEALALIRNMHGRPMELTRDVCNVLSVCYYYNHDYENALQYALEELDLYLHFTPPHQHETDEKIRRSKETIRKILERLSR